MENIVLWPLEPRNHIHLLIVYELAKSAHAGRINPKPKPAVVNNNQVVAIDNQLRRAVQSADCWAQVVRGLVEPGSRWPLKCNYTLY